MTTARGHFTFRPAWTSGILSRGAIIKPKSFTIGADSLNSNALTGVVLIPSDIQHVALLALTIPDTPGATITIRFGCRVRWTGIGRPALCWLIIRDASLCVPINFISRITLTIPDTPGAIITIRFGHRVGWTGIGRPALSWLIIRDAGLRFSINFISSITLTIPDTPGATINIRFGHRVGWTGKGRPAFLGHDAVSCCCASETVSRSFLGLSNAQLDTGTYKAT